MAESKWKERASWLAPKHIEHEVGGETYKFRAVSVGTAARLSSIGGPIVEALTVLFTPADTDIGKVHRKFGEGEETIVQPLEPALAEFRSKERARALERAFAALTEEKNLRIVADLIMESMFEVYPPEEKLERSTKEFVAETPLPVLREMLVGLFKANKDVLGPFGETALTEMGRAASRTLGPSSTT